MDHIRNTVIAMATAVATIPVATIAVVAPAVAIPVDIPAPRTEVVTVDRPCYMQRPGWNTPADWEQPVCQTVLRATRADTTPGEPAGPTDDNRARLDFGDNGGA